LVTTTLFQKPSLVLAKVLVWEGFVARIFQHEADHLVGKVFLDRVQSEGDLLCEDEYQAMEIATLPSI
ncbi:MAG: hypothetical protein DCF17_19245, partial [Shackletoniella antarctica]